jgi:hypothetical protein
LSNAFGQVEMSLNELEGIFQAIEKKLDPILDREITDATATDRNGLNVQSFPQAIEVVVSHKNRIDRLYYNMNRLLGRIAL